MKKIIVILLLGTMALPGLLPAQSVPAQSSSTSKTVSSEPNPAPQLTRFDLDFPGGTPGELVKAIEKASQKDLNVIIPPDFDRTQIPALKMRGVTVAEMFNALNKAIQFRGTSESYGFMTEGGPREDSVWYFYHQGRAPDTSKEKAVICRFYQLAPYLETYKVEDITTAIDTGWRMLGETHPPKVSFHKDTKLLIAVGEPDKLSVIDSVLVQLIAKSSQGLPAPGKNGEPAKK